MSMILKYSDRKSVPYPACRICLVLLTVLLCRFPQSVLSDDQALRIKYLNELNELGADVTTNYIHIPATARLSDADLLKLLATHVVGISVQCTSLTSDGIVAYLEKAEGISFITWEGPGVTDEVLAAIAGQESLTHLTLRGPFRGDGLASYFNRPVSKTLRYLSLRPERFQRKGEFGWKFGLTTEGISTIGSFKNLQELSLTNCGIPDERLRYLAGLKELEALELDGNPINGSGLMWLEELDALERLHLNFCRLSDRHFVEFPALDSLRWLAMSGNQIGDAAVARVAAADTPELQDLSVARTDITDDGLAALAAIPKLRRLHLAGTRVEGHGLAVLSDLPVKVVSLAWAPVSPEVLDVLAKFPQLGSLDVSGSPLTDNDIPALERLSNLVYLNVTRTGISKQGVDRLRRHFPECNVYIQESTSEIWEVDRPGGRLPTQCED